ncbi:MAG TPA: TraR/DksA C4-type zinc finger protein [Casimicrobiaceae bacterium]|nr:TraR/DksA C4-type zinc finger protein [Casimicrobiaceae bacterium]
MTTNRKPLGADERAALHAKLVDRQRHLRAEIAKLLRTQDDPRVVGMRNQMEETDDWAVADAMVLRDIAAVSHQLNELRDVEDAIRRLAEGSYGECEECGAPIPYARLEAYPMARRCVPCQEAIEAAERRLRPSPPPT